MENGTGANFSVFQGESKINVTVIRPNAQVVTDETPFDKPIHLKDVSNIFSNV